MKNSFFRADLGPIDEKTTLCFAIDLIECPLINEEEFEVEIAGYPENFKKKNNYIELMGMRDKANRNNNFINIKKKNYYKGMSGGPLLINDKAEENILRSVGVFINDDFGICFSKEMLHEINKLIGKYNEEVCLSNEIYKLIVENNEEEYININSI